MAPDRPLPKAEAAGWFSAVPSSAVIGVGGVVVLLLRGTRHAAAAVVENVRTAESLPEPILRVGRLGAILDVALAFVLPPGTGEIACEGRVRRAVRDELRDLPYNVWITVEFGYDAELFESGA